jgi:hypothetical protein
VKPLGPDQDHVPVVGCGPMLTAVVVELTEALVSADHIPLTDT